MDKTRVRQLFDDIDQQTQARTPTDLAVALLLLCGEQVPRAVIARDSLERGRIVGWRIWAIVGHHAAHLQARKTLDPFREDEASIEITDSRLMGLPTVRDGLRMTELHSERGDDDVSVYPTWKLDIEDGLSETWSTHSATSHWQRDAVFRFVNALLTPDR